MVLTRLVTQKPIVIAGLKWPPEICPRAETMMAIARPCAMAIPDNPRLPAPWRNWSAHIAPAPKKIRAKVPINSAVSFWAVLYIWFLRRVRRKCTARRWRLASGVLSGGEKGNGWRDYGRWEGAWR